MTKGQKKAKASWSLDHVSFLRPQPASPLWPSTLLAHCGPVLLVLWKQTSSGDTRLSSRLRPWPLPPRMG